MFLARREFGKIPRVYAIRGAHRPQAWPFVPANPETGKYTQASLNAGTGPGICATGDTRAAALENLYAAEEAGIDELTVLE